MDADEYETASPRANGPNDIQKTTTFSCGFIVGNLVLSDFNADARDGLAGEVRLFGLYEGDDTIFCGVNGKVTGHISSFACEFGATCLADDDFASLNFLTAKALDTKTLAGIVVDVLSGSTRFDM